MITGNIKAFRARCRERGYTLDEVRPCIVSEDGETITVDETHSSYPRTPRPGFVKPQAKGAQPPPSPTSGPGTELKKLLKTWLRIEASPTCSCNARAKRMDIEEERSPGWCEAHLDEIVGWLREEAEKRKLPFLDLAARLVVRRAVANARRLSANATENTSTPRG